ncbi:MAG: N-acetylmuramoyl-L-alanine amidase [Defluviitaleaceae bacterium]|nr:N-acetylmuramoyl-L-alanine amidase [Defluviitaleaceae bacterium]MCL2264179.1 N-acetylmuramoyl-L-alanine amidase [Defluviitaleaceae bacterium]
MKAYRVFIDPGHGGRDSGAAGNGMRESDVVLEVSKRFGIILICAGIEVMYSRIKDVSPAQRWQAANAWGADLYVSVHCNGFLLDTANGYETFFAATKPADRDVANIFQSEFINATGLRDRGVKMDSQSQHSGGLSVLRRTSMPAVLVELAFITANPNAHQDVPTLRDRRPLMAEALANGVFKFFGIQPQKAKEVVEMVYRTIQEMPSWAQEGMQQLVDMRVLSGRTPDNLDIDENMMRILLVVHRMFDRAGLLDAVAENM